MSLLKIPERPGRAQDAKVASQVKKRSAAPVKSGGGLLGRINEIKAFVEKNLGEYKDKYQVINQKELLHDYITDCIGTGYISIDTETNGLDPLQNDLVGICINTRQNKGSYIPLNHISYITGAKADNQLDMQFVTSEFKRLFEKKPEIDMFNAKFDIRFLRAAGLYKVYCTWDGFLAAKLMNENEPSHGLKQLHRKYVLENKKDVFSFDELFKGITFDKIPINVGYLYAANDPVITTELCDYQRKFLYYNPDEPKDARNGMNGVAWVFENIEMPCLPVVCDMEDIGVKFDFKYQEELSDKYNRLLTEKQKNFYDACDVYADAIEKYKSKNINHKLDTPINIGSPVQIAILLYDIMQIEPPDAKNPRGTGEAILRKIDNPVVNAILEYREISKLVTTYIDKLPNCVNPDDNRIHCSFNQYGANTGRFSSSDPNLQNIPSHNKDIRKMFVATDEDNVISTDTQTFEIDRWCEVECADGWKYADGLSVNDIILADEGERLKVIEVYINSDSVKFDFELE